MNRNLVCLLLIWAFVTVQGLSLHAHLPHAHDLPSAAHAGHDSIHFHSHAIDGGVDDEHETDAAPIDLFMSVKARDVSALPLIVAVAALWMLIVALWICIGRSPPPPAVLRIIPPPFRDFSPRAPPR